MTDLCKGPDPRPRAPRVEVPAGATDTHFHLFGDPARYGFDPGREYTPPVITPGQARHLFATLGIERAVVIQASVYGTDNRAQLDGAAEIGTPCRAVVVLPYEASDADFAALHERGARGLRYILAHPGGLPVADLERFGGRMKELGWHIQFFAKGAQIAELESRIAKLPCPVVIDHMGLFLPGAGTDQPAFQALLRLLRRGAWVKLSGAYRLSAQPPPYSDLTPYVRELVATRPDRLVWASDWPHVFFKGDMPNTTDLLEALAAWVPDEGTRNRILAENPAALYGF